MHIDIEMERDFAQKTEAMRGAKGFRGKRVVRLNDRGKKIVAMVNFL